MRTCTVGRNCLTRVASGGSGVSLGVGTLRSDPNAVGGGKTVSAHHLLSAVGDSWFGSHNALPLRGHQYKALRKDRVPGRPPGSTSERLPHADDPPLDVLRRLAEWGR